MDSSNAPEISSTTNRLYFKGPYRRQNWSLPDSIIYYITKNPSSSKGYQKLIQSCKYFFSKNSIIICSYLIFYGEENESEIEIRIHKNREKKHINLKDFSQSFWITDVLSIFAEGTGKENVVSSLIPNIFQCDVKELTLGNQLISLNELLFLALKADKIFLSECTVKNDDGCIVSVEKIIETFDQVKTFYYEFKDNDPSNSSKTVENLLKISHFSSINNIYFGWISEIFDIETFYVYMKKNNHTFFDLRFNDSTSDAYENRLNEIVDEILATENRNYKPPFIDFDGLSGENFSKLRRIAN